MSDEKKFKSIEELLEERERLDKILEEEFRKEVTIIFTDIKGSTQYFETRGDIEGLSMIRKHNEMHFPTIESHGGRVVKTIGDAIMAAFEDPASAVRAAIEMQNNLMYFNKNRNKGDQIHIRVGINTGVALYKDNDIYGDAVNLAARVESKSEPDQIIISDSVYKAVKDSDDIICRFHGNATFKGKSGEIKLYRVVWSEEQLVEESEFKKTGTRRMARKPDEKRVMFEIDASLEKSQLKLSSFERVRGEERTIHHYEDIKVNAEDVARICKEITNLLNRANKRGRVSKEILKQLQTNGQLLFDAILNEDTKKKLAATKANDLMLRLDDNLVHIPWELLYDGKSFFCQRFSMGRIVSTRQAVNEGVQRSISRPLKMLVLADPRGDLPHAAQEGARIRDVLDAESDHINANLKASDITAEFAKSKLRDYDVVHYAGHADYDSKNPANSGWMLKDGKFSSTDVRAMVGGRPLPALVFANGCQSGTTDQWNVNEDYEQQIFGLANAFLLAGVKHYIGTFWDILDSPGADFAIAFYREMLDGQSVGEAVRRARMELIDKFGEDTIVWASYMLYGDPSQVYIEAEDAETEAVETAGAARAEPMAAAGATRGAASATMTGGEVRTKGPSFATISLSILAILLVLLVGVLVFRSGGDKINTDVKVGSDASVYEKAFALLRSGKAADAEKAFLAMSQQGDKTAEGNEGLAAVYFETGKIDESRVKAAQAIQTDPNRMYAHVVLGKIAMSDQDYETARNEFMTATKSQGGLDWQRSLAYNELGRIYAANGEDGQAIQSYASASKLDPKQSESLTNQGVALMRSGKTEEARTVLEKAQKVAPNDVMVASLLRDVVSRQEMAANTEKQTQIRETLNDLIASADKPAPPRPAGSVDEWTSRPLTISFLDLKSVGLIPGREGENEYILLMITQAFQKDGRVRVVDRTMLDAVLNELKLSTSDLANPSTQLKLGKILSARLIGTGSIIRDAESVQLSIQVIETETTDIAVALAEALDAKMPISKVAEKISEMILNKIKGCFPARGIVKQVVGEEVTLNIGSDVGVSVGQKLALVDDRIDGEGRVLGTIEITSAGKVDAKAKILDKKTKVFPGMKVEEQVTP